MLNTVYTAVSEELCFHSGGVPSCHTLEDSEAIGSTDAQTIDMTLADGACSDKGGNNERAPKVKRMRLENCEEFLVLECDMETTVESAIANAIADLDLRYLIRKKVRKRLSDIDKLECEYVDLDIAFDRIQRCLDKLHDGEKLERAALLATPEVNFEDDFTTADTDFKLQEASSSEKATTPADVIYSLQSARNVEVSPGVDDTNYSGSAHTL